MHWFDACKIKTVATNDFIIASFGYILADRAEIRRFIRTWTQLGIAPQQQWLLAAAYGDPTEDGAWKPTEF